MIDSDEDTRTDQVSRWQSVYPRLLQAVLRGLRPALGTSALIALLYNLDVGRPTMLLLLMAAPFLGITLFEIVQALSRREDDYQSPVDFEVNASVRRHSKELRSTIDNLRRP